MQLTSRPRRLARSLVDRALAPHVREIISQVGSSPVGPVAAADDDDAGRATTDPAGVPSDYFHNLLHAARTVELRRLHGTARRVLSVGASGSWYFRWFEDCVGPLEQHVGVEAFEPKPDDLPANVAWIESSADHFAGVDDNTIDMVFAGQTTEHLWSDELASFLLESHRVLVPDGQIVLDSPNRLITEQLRWSHGGHSVELDADEITRLLELAGFEVTAARGVWRCRIDDQVLDLEHGLIDPELLVRRIAEAADHPDDCFVWWVVGRRTGQPDVEHLRAATSELYQRHWPTRISRGMWPGPPTDFVDIGPGDTSVCSLPVYLRPGTTTIAIALREGSFDDADDWSLRLTTPGGYLVLELPRHEATQADQRLSWTFEVEQLLFAASIEFHVANLTRSVRLQMPIDIEAARL